MEYLLPKAPGDALAYFIDWSKQLGSDVIDTFFVEVSQGAILIAADPAPANFGQFIRVVVSGGADGEIAQIYCYITTLNGQALSRTLSLPISSAAIAVTPSTATKRAVVQMAFEEAGLAGYEFDATDAENASALRRLDALMAMWRTLYPGLNYNAPTVIGTGALADESGLPDDAINAVVTSLAYRIAPGIGKSMNAEARIAYAQAMNALRARYGRAVVRRLPAATPRGAGAKPWSTWQPFAGVPALADLGGVLTPVIVAENGQVITTEAGQQIAV